MTLSNDFNWLRDAQNLFWAFLFWILNYYVVPLLIIPLPQHYPSYSLFINLLEKPSLPQRGRKGT